VPATSEPADPVPMAPVAVPEVACVASACLSRVVAGTVGLFRQMGSHGMYR
jgi:hypothetical protein